MHARTYKHARTMHTISYLNMRVNQSRTRSYCSQYTFERNRLRWLQDRGSSFPRQLLEARSYKLQLYLFTNDLYYNSHRKQVIKNSTQVSKKLRQDIQQLIIRGGVGGSKVKGERRCKMTEYV